MAFPQQQYPQVVHLFVNQFNTLLSSGANAITDFYTGCTKHCINFLSLYSIQSVLPGSATALSNFINLGKTSYGIIDFAGSIDLYNPASNGLSRFNLIDTYNTNNPSNKINWITLENEFWNLSSQPNISYNSSCQVSNSSVVTLINGLTTAASYFVVGNPITIDGYNRQIVSINSATQITLDRPINAAIVSGNITIYDVANTTYMLNFDTFLERLKTLRGLTQSKGMKIEAYLARKIPAVQWRQLVPYIDRVLIENDYDKYNYCLYNDPSATKNRTILQYITTDRTGTLNIANGFNNLYGTGTLFTQELGIGTKIVSNGQIFTIQNIASDTVATTIETANATITNGTFKSYTNFAPIYYINDLYPDRRSWLTGATIPNAKSIIDVYKLYTLTSYSVAGVTQSGSIPISYNNETDPSITAATNLVGISIFSRTPLQALSPFILSGLTVPTTNFSLLLTKTDPNSDISSNGTITASFNSVGLTPPYTYVYSSNTISYTSTTNSTTNTQIGLKSGLWKVFVKDNVNNTSNIASITLVQKFHTFTTLNTIASGVTFFISGGVSTYNLYTVDQNNVADGFFSVTGLAGGTYNYTSPFVVGNTYRFNVTDSVSAKVTGLIATIPSTATLTLSLDSYTNPACSTTNNGILNVSVLGSSGPFTYVYSKPGTTITHTNVLTNYDSINNASVGNWQIYVSDGITTSNTASISLTSSFFATTSTIPGVLTFNITGGTAPYRITSTNVNPILKYTANTSGNYSIIVPGGATYDFSIQDANNCITYVNQYVLIALTPTIVLTGFTNPSSNSLANGSIGVSATGGITPYSYSINGGPYGSSGIFTGLSAGTYTITVKDSQTPTPLTSSLLRTLVQTFNVSIYSGSSICLTASGGTAPYFVSVNGGPNSAYTSPNYTCYSGVCGNNNVVVTDSVGNYYSANTYVVCPLQISYTSTPISCIGRVDGELNIVATKGVPPYIYYLYYPSFISPINNSTGNFQNIGGGVSTIIVTDSDTPSNSASTTVNLNQTFNVLSTTVTGGTYLNISGGSSPYIVSYIKVPSQTTGTTTFTAVTAGQYFIPGLSSTLYVFSVRDNTNCTISNIRSTIPTVNSTLSIDIYSIVYPGCNTSPTGGQIFFSGSGGATPYVSYSASNGTTTYSYTTGGTFYNLSAGIWTLYLEDTLGTVEVDYVILNNTEITPIVNIDYPNREVCITVPTNNLSPLTYDVIVGSSSYVISNENVSYCYPFTGCSTLYISVCPQSPALSGCCYQNTFDISEGIDYTVTTTFINNQPNICLDINLNSSYVYPYLITFSGNTQYYNPASNNCFQVDSCGGTYNITMCNTPSNTIEYGFKTVFDFSSAPKQAIYPYGSLLEVSEGIFYGMTYDGGLNNLGTIFSADTNGNFDILVSLKGQSFNDGARPYGSLIKASDGKLYGMTFEGGQYNLGCIFNYSYGTSINIIHSFSYGIIASPDSKDGARPYGDLIQASNGNLYGITSAGGVNDNGIIFSCNTSGNYKKIYEFDATSSLGGFDPSYYSYNLIEPINGFLYGTTTVSNGGANAGSLFSYEINNNLPPVRRITLTSHIVAPLCFGFNGYIYGLTIDGGVPTYGEIIKVNTNGSGYQVIYEFSGQTYGDGATPYGGLKQMSNGLLCGLTTFGGINDKGIVYTLDIINEEYTKIASFDDKLTGYYPFYTSLIESLNGKLYGMSSDGGANLKGTIFEISLTGQTTGCCITETVIVNNTTLPAPNIYGTIISGTSNVCIEIDTNNFYLPPYQVVVDGTYNSYDTLLTTNCYGIGSSCGPIQVQICTADFSNNNYFIVHKLDDSITDQEGFKSYCKLLEYSSGIFYGLTADGGRYSGGVIFSSDTLGNYLPIYDFGDPITPNDGLSPFGSLIKSSFDNFMYGMTSDGGTKNMGIIFKIDNLGNYTKLFDFDNLFGEKPYGSLTEDPINTNILYGLTSEGGLYGRGIIFSIDISILPISVTPLYDFDPSGVPFNGFTPLGSLIYLNSGPFAPTGILAGTTKEDSANNLGGLFVFDLVLSSIIQSTYFNTNEGTYPLGDLLWDSSLNLFYGLTNVGGQYNYGTLFSWDLSIIVPLFNFKDNYTGINPKGSLIFGSDNKLYGMTGTFPYDYGTIFSFDLSTNYFHRIYEFLGGSDGAYPGTSLLEATDGKLYGVTAYGGKAYGTIFSLDKDSRPVCCYVETLGSVFSADIQTTWFTTIPGLCVTIDTNNFNNPTYAVQINTASGDTFNFIYDPNIGQNCYSLPISACGISTVTVSSGLPGYAYSFDELYRFSTINGTGTVPFGSLVQASNGILYGMTFFTTFPSGYGVIFSCDTSGNYGSIHTFGIGSDGRSPYGSLIQATNGDLYGTTYDGGTYQYGTIFKIATNGSYSPGILRSFRLLATDGTSPYGSLFQASDGFLYGLTEYGPSPGLNSGTLFKCDLNGGSFSILHNFGSISNDGINPKGSVIEVSTGILYGMTSDGGTNLKGTIFSSNTSGSLYGIIHNFSGTTYLDGDAGNFTGSLLLGTNNIIYGSTPFGGQYNFGTIFSCDTLGSYGIIYNFTGNGKYPVGGLIEHNNGLLYGMTADGGLSNGNGIIFSFDKDTKDYEVLYDFSDDPTIDITPRSSLIEGLDGNLYGMGQSNSGSGIIFKLNVQTSTGPLCTYTESVDILCQSVPLTASVTTIASCTTGSTGELTVYYNGGSPNYVITAYIGSINNPTQVYKYTATTEGYHTFLGLSPRIWNVYIQDHSYIVPYNFSAFTVNMSRIDVDTNIVNDQLCVSYSASSSFTGANSTMLFYIDDLTTPITGTTLSSGTICFTATCGTNHTLRVSEGQDFLPGCDYYETFIIPCPPVGLTLLIGQPFCVTTAAAVTAYASGGLPPYTYQIIDYTTNAIYSAQTLNDEYQFNILPLTNHNYVAYLSDSLGNSATPVPFVITPSFYSDISFSNGNTILQFSGASAVRILVNNVVVTTGSGGYTSVPINQITTLQYPLSCGTNNTVTITGRVVDPDIPCCPFTYYYCSSSGSTFIPCDLVCDTYFVQPLCSGQSINDIQLLYTGGTPNYYLELTNGSVLYTASTSATNFTFSPTNINPPLNPTFNVTAGTWTVRVTDTLSDSCSQTINIVPTFNAIVNNITTTGFCLTISGGVGGYVVLFDGVAATSVSPTVTTSGNFGNSTYCFTGTCGNHTITVENNSVPCVITNNFNIPCNSLNCNYLFVNPSCDQISDGMITTNVVGGTPPYNFYLTNNTTQNTLSQLNHPTGSWSFINVSTGSWTISATSSDGLYCSSTLLLDGTFAVSSSASTNNEICLNISGGTPNYDIYINNNIVISGVNSPGLYCVSANCNYNEWLVIDSVGCQVSGTTNVYCGLSIFLSATTNPGCDGAHNGQIVVYATGGTSPYSYSASNGTTIFTNNTGIFTNLNSDTWYLSVTDLSGSTANLTLPITLINSLYSNIVAYVNGFCVTITGGTQPYYVYLGNTSLGWDSNNVTNCYSADCTTISTITVRDSSI